MQQLLVSWLLIGVLLTQITQSSSATVAAALTALNAGILDLPQAAAVIRASNCGFMIGLPGERQDTRTPPAIKSGRRPR